MSTDETKKPESELGLDLDLHFLPAWAQQPPKVNQFEQYTGHEGEDRRGRGDRRSGAFGQRGDRGPRRFDGPRPGGGEGGSRFQGQGPGGPGRGPRPGGDRAPGGGDRRGGPRRGSGGFGQRDDRGPARPEIKLPDLEVSFIPEEKGVESLARQIKLTGRAYPLFEIAYLVLKKPERYHVQLSSKKKEDGTPAQFMYVCGLDDTLWLDENEAMVHVLDKHFGTFYASEKIPTDPPKGTYTFVAQCGISGTILGPPNYHDYQNKLRKLHQERFARMPFDAFKSRIRIVKDEAVVKKWLEEQSYRTEYTCLNIPDTIKLNTREEVDRHFRETHLANVIKPVDNYTLPATAVAGIQNRALSSVIRRAYDEQMRFPLKVVNILSGQFARQGLQFFKVNKSVTHVAVARPRFLDLEESPVSDGIRKIVDFINAHPRTTRKKLLEALAPGGAIAPPEVKPAEPAVEGQPAETPAPTVASPEAATVVSDLHWLLHQGHVIEFANGILETAKKPLPRPPRPERQPKPVAEGARAEAAETAGEHADAELTGEGTHAEHQPSESSEAREGDHSMQSSESGEQAQVEETAHVQDESGASAGVDVAAGQEFPLSRENAPAGTEEQKPAA